MATKDDTTGGAVAATEATTAPTTDAPPPSSGVDPEIAEFVVIERITTDGAPSSSSSSTSSSSSSDAQKEAEDAADQQRKRLPKKKVALVIGYCGTGFKGMQKNPGVETIEDVLEQAIYGAGGMIKENLGKLQKINWQRCARTDKGVHALSQVVSLKMIVEPEGVIDRINALLPPQIRVFDMKRVAASFNAKSFCDSRTYEYIMPTFAFAPSPKRRPELCGQPFVFDETTRELTNSVLAFYVGTHNFHNFTAKLEAKEASATRHMKSFTCSEPFVLDGIEYVRLEVTGSSFLLHQIRKMIGFAVALIRDRAEISKVREMMRVSFSKKKLMLPMAPGLGLMLQTVYFAGYNKKFSKTHDILDLAHYKDIMKRFQLEYIYPQITKQEKEEQETKKWVDLLEEFPLDYDSFLTDKEAQPGKRRKTSESSFKATDSPASDASSSTSSTSSSSAATTTTTPSTSSSETSV